MVDPSEVIVKIPDIPELRRIGNGKVRSIFEFDTGLLLFVASDRISARDVVLSPGIPLKGWVLNNMSTFFFERTSGIAPNHLVRMDQLSRPLRRKLTELYKAYPWLAGRSMVVRSGQVVPIEFIFRTHIAGSFFSAYEEAGGPRYGANVFGHQLPAGMKNGDSLPEPIFTPSTKAPSGEHDQNLTYDGAVAHLLEKTDLGETKACRVLNWGQTRGLALTAWGYRYAKERGFILADHKLEVVLGQGAVELIGDELFTPDSSRFLDRASLERGEVVHVDKEPVRRYLDQYYSGSGTPPRLTREVVVATVQRYQRIYQALVG